MAKRVITVCDLADSSCNGDVRSFRIWVEGSRAAAAVDLCEVHSSCLETLTEHGDEVELPVRPRASMQVTQLKTTAATARFKKPKDG